MKKTEKITNIYNELDKIYPEAKCALHFDTDYELLFATRLSAQCTDVRVNIVTKDLFKKYKTLNDYKEADFYEIYNIIKPCGLGKSKAKNIIDCAYELLDRFDGRVPDNMEDLLSLSGVGRKTANLILGDLYKKPSIIADTHCIRLSNRLGLTKSKNPDIVEKDLRKSTPQDLQTRLCHLFVWHGRNICDARNPKCDDCTIKEYCTFVRSKGVK